MGILKAIFSGGKKVVHSSGKVIKSSTKTGKYIKGTIRK